MLPICVLHQEFGELKEKDPLKHECTVGSDRQPVLYLDELVRSNRGPVPTEIIHFLSSLFLSFEPFNTRTPSRSPHSQGTFKVDLDNSLGLLNVFAWVWDADAFNLCGELIYHCRYSSVGYSILGERESQKTARDLIWGVYEYTPAHRTFNMLVPPSTCSMESREEVFDHAQRTEGVTAIRVGHSHGMCDDLQAQSAREVFLEEAKCIARLGLVLHASSDVVQLLLALLEDRQVFLDLLQGRPQSREF